MANIPNPIKTQTTLYIVGGIVVIAVASIIYLAIAKPILQKIGVLDDKKDKEKEDAIKEFDKSQWFTSLPYKANKSQITISETRANALAKEIFYALESRTVKPSLVTRTLDWYKELIEWEERIKYLAPDGHIL